MKTQSLTLASLLVSMAGLIACGGASDAVITPDSDGGAMPGSDGGGKDDGGSSSDAKSEASPSEAGSDAGDTRIDPIVVGHSWTYNVTIFGSYPLCTAGSHDGVVLGTKMLDGKPSFQVQSLCPGVGTLDYAVMGDVVQFDYMATWVLALDAPVAEGHTWHSAGSVTVPAGTYPDCWKATQNVGYEAYTVFCRGVGPVHWYTKNGSNGYEAMLTSKNF
jgi:hypothetical protein